MLDRLDDFRCPGELGPLEQFESCPVNRFRLDCVGVVQQSHVNLNLTGCRDRHHFTGSLPSDCRLSLFLRSQRRLLSVNHDQVSDLRGRHLDLLECLSPSPMSDSLRPYLNRIRLLRRFDLVREFFDIASSLVLS